MIELRWLEKLVQEHNVHIRVLQYRQATEAFGMPIAGWSEWKDVPTVKEEEES